MGTRRWLWCLGCCTSGKRGGADLIAALPRALVMVEAAARLVRACALVYEIVERFPDLEAHYALFYIWLSPGPPRSPGLRHVNIGLLGWVNLKVATMAS